MLDSKVLARVIQGVKKKRFRLMCCALLFLAQGVMAFEVDVKYRTYGNSPLVELYIKDQDGNTLAHHENIYVRVYEQKPDWFPYVVVEESTGGNRCCITHYFYDTRGDFKSPHIMPKSSIFLRIEKDMEGFFVWTATGQSLYLK